VGPLPVILNVITPFLTGDGAHLDKKDIPVMIGQHISPNVPPVTKQGFSGLNLRETKGLAIKPFFKAKMEVLICERFSRRNGRHIAVVSLTRWGPY